MHRHIVFVVVAIALFVAAAMPAFAAKGGNGNGGAGTSTITLVTLGTSTLSAASASTPTVGDYVTFDVQTSATDSPYIILNCYQGRDWIYTAQAFFSASSPPVFTLASSAWTSGDASCTARLGALNADGTRFRELASTDFNVAG